MTDSELLKRLEKLERDNRRLKRFGLAALALVAGLGLVAAARPVPKVIKAHEFEVVNSAGTVRIRMGVSPKVQAASITLFDAAGKLRSDFDATDTFSGLFLYGHQRRLAVAIAHAAHNWVHQAGQHQLKDTGSHSDILLGQSTSTGIGGISIGISGAGEPRVNMYDPQGFSMVLGSAGLENFTTGETRQTSADSIVMFGNGKHHVIWQAP